MWLFGVRSISDKSSAAFQNSFPRLFAAIISGFLLWFGWVPFLFPCLLFFAFIPLFAIEEITSQRLFQGASLSIVKYIYTALLLWNFSAGWWLFKTSIGGALLAMFLNAAMQIDSNDSISWYHKSKLVPGLETIPFANHFGFFERFAIYLGGIRGSFGKPRENVIFFSSDNQDGVAPVICHESVFGEYVGGLVKMGAQAIFILTNDGWWGETPGYRQHQYYASLRAIETRRSVIRCANTGISCIINQRGDIEQATNYGEEAFVSGFFRMNKKSTFYVRHGDYLGRFSILGSCIFIFGHTLIFFISHKSTAQQTR